ncbi:flavonol synthase/flavanone 3-hydroxylase-like [Silene latifolia]|uniref:flavonol synthase/flavanone 3-hydroxylase-like n=1 Tax=Silene latifolia TaxID=37657 RepID=UPI003D78246C
MEGERVQNIAMKSKTLDNIPSEFIRLEHEQPTLTTVHGSILQIPTIDLDNVDEEKAVEMISNASQEWGLFQIVNHGIPNEVIANLQKVGKEFFELPQEEKEIIAKPLGYNNGTQGYGTKLQKEVYGKKGWVDHLFHNVWPPSIVDYQFWPSNPPSYREANEEYTKHLRQIGDKLLKYMSKGLGLEDNEIKETSGGEELVYLLKINYYPPCPRPDLALGVVAHTDMSVLTILVPNDVPGLQVSRDGLWYDVKYIPNALIIHVGDQMEIMSNGKYKAVLHRTTVNKDRTRMSWPVFLEPPSEHEVGPIEKLISDENPAKYKKKKYGDYKYCKLNKIPQ